MALLTNPTSSGGVFGRYIRRARHRLPRIAGVVPFGLRHHGVACQKLIEPLRMLHNSGRAGKKGQYADEIQLQQRGIIINIHVSLCALLP
jgi:hypothetical protein